MKIAYIIFALYLPTTSYTLPLWFILIVIVRLASLNIIDGFVDDDEHGLTNQKYGTKINSHLFQLVCLVFYLLYLGRGIVAASTWPTALTAGTALVMGGCIIHRSYW